MHPAPEDPVLLSTPADLAHYLDTSCHNWSLYYAGQDLPSTLKATSYPTELAATVNAEEVALDVWFKDCTPERKCSLTNDDGQTWGSTLPHELTPLPYDYYQQRLEQSTNPYLRARYALLLWNAPKPYKHIRFAQAAIDNLFTALDTAGCLDAESSRNCIELLKQACDLIVTVRHREADAVSAVVGRFTGAIPFEHGNRTSLLRIITKHPKLFKSADPELILAASFALYTHYFQNKDFFTCENICKLVAPYVQGLGRDPREWHQRLGQAYEGEAANRPARDDSSLMAIEFYTRAAKAYQLAGDSAAEDAALQCVQTLKPKLKLHAITTEFTAEQTQLLMEDIRLQTDLLLKHGPNEILDFLACSDRVIPNHAEIKEKAAEEKPSFLSAISTIYIDGNKNTSHGDKSPPKAKSNTKDAATEAAEKREKELNKRVSQSYSLALSFRLQYLMPIFIEGYRTGKINYETFCQYLETHSWTAQTIIEQDITGEAIEYTWQPMLRPGLQEFFTQLHKFIHEGPTASSFVLCLDSLTLKIEGLLREVLQKMGAHTIATHKRHDLREVFFDDLLDLALTKALLNENECYFLRYVFTPLGKNLRNDIAHGYYHLSERYSIQKVVLLVIALLRVTGFQLGTETQTENNAPN